MTNYMKLAASGNNFAMNERGRPIPSLYRRSFTVIIKETVLSEVYKYSVFGSQAKCSPFIIIIH